MSDSIHLDTLDQDTHVCASCSSFSILVTTVQCTISEYKFNIYTECHRCIKMYWCNSVRCGGDPIWPQRKLPNKIFLGGRRIHQQPSRSDGIVSEFKDSQIKGNEKLIVIRESSIIIMQMRNQLIVHNSSLSKLITITRVLRVVRSSDSWVYRILPSVECSQ
jgi:hypothetical protein